MIGLYGCVRISPAAFGDSLAVGLKKRGLSIVALSAHTPLPSQSADIVLLQSVDALLIHGRHMRNWRCICVVFDCTEKLAELPNVEVLDKTRAIALRDLGTIIFDVLANKKAMHIVLTHKRIDVITPVLEEKKSVGFIHLYNTTLYSISNKSVREEIRQLVFSRMAGKLSADALNSRAEAITPRKGKGRDAVQSLIDVVNGDLGEKLRSALQAVIVKKTMTVEQAVEIFGVVAYDLRYFIATIAKQNKETHHASQKAASRKR